MVNEGQRCVSRDLWLDWALYMPKGTEAVRVRRTKTREGELINEGEGRGEATCRRLKKIGELPGSQDVQGSRGSWS